MNLLGISCRKVVRPPAQELRPPALQPSLDLVHGLDHERQVDADGAPAVPAQAAETEVVAVRAVTADPGLDRGRVRVFVAATDVQDGLHQPGEVLVDGAGDRGREGARCLLSE